MKEVVLKNANENQINVEAVNILWKECHAFCTPDSFCFLSSYGKYQVGFGLFGEPTDSTIECIKYALNQDHKVYQFETQKEMLEWGLQELTKLKAVYPTCGHCACACDKQDSIYCFFKQETYSSDHSACDKFDKHEGLDPYEDVLNKHGADDSCGSGCASNTASEKKQGLGDEVMRRAKDDIASEIMKLAEGKQITAKNDKGNFVYRIEDINKQSEGQQPEKLLTFPQAVKEMQKGKTVLSSGSLEQKWKGLIIKDGYFRLINTDGDLCSLAIGYKDYISEDWYVVEEKPVSLDCDFCGKKQGSVRCDENGRPICNDCIAVAQHLTFEQAISSAKRGKKIARKGWKIKSVFVYLKNSMKEVESCGKWEDFEKTQHLCRGNSDDFCGEIIGWQPNQADMLSDDWYIVD